MSNLQNWSNVVQRVQNANIQDHYLENQIHRINKRAYKQELDRELEYKQYENAVKSAYKLRQLQEAKLLAEAQKSAKMRQKHQKTQLHRHYGYENQQLSQLQHNMKSTTRQLQNQTIHQFLQHPFVKLVQGQDNRMQKQRANMRKQNAINHLQQEIKNHQKNENKYKERVQKNEFIDHMQKTHEKRNQQRERFKSKYLRIKRGEVDPRQDYAQIIENPPQSIEKSYIKYLNNQILQNSQRKKQQKSQFIDDPRLGQFYSSNKLQPDSSPAFLGRNPLSHQRRRQLFYISKNLGVNHERSYTSEMDVEGNTTLKGQNIRHQKDTRLSEKDIRMTKILNPEEDKSYLLKQYNPTRQYQNNSESLRQKSMDNRYLKVQTQPKEKRIQHSVQNDNIGSLSFRTQKLPSFDKSRRLKSQLQEQHHHNQRKLPIIYKQQREPMGSSIKMPIPPLQSQREQKSLNRPEKRQFFRYDPITGKQVALYV